MAVGLTGAVSAQEPLGASADARRAAELEVSAGLAQQLLEGGPQALGAVYDTYGSRCYALAYRVLGDAALAEDAVQEAFMALWRAPDRFDVTRGSMLTYLLTLTHRRSVDVLRREANQRRGRISAEALDNVPSTEREVSDQAETEARSEVVRDALAALPQAQREALVLAYFQGYTQREIAAITRVPLGTVKTRMLAGVRRLRAELGGWHEAWGEMS